MEKYALRAREVSKKFSITLKDSLRYGLIDCGRQMIRKPAQSGVLRGGEFWALNNISFDLEHGTCLGIMGVNGSGKSTLLRILNGTYPPDTGEVRIKGKVGALVAAGAGFSPMLTGRENIYVNGTLLGLTPKQIRSKMDEIIHFAELENFIDMPVRSYSSGMAVRLGFAISATSQPEVLLIDEVLAVGDLNFQKKCFEYILKLKKQGCAIILVSHAIGAIWSVCDTGLFLHKGVQEYVGDIEEVCRRYDNKNSAQRQKASLSSDYGHEKGGSGDVVYSKVEVIATSSNEVTKEVDFREPFIVRYHLNVKKKIDLPIFRSSIDAQHYKFIVSIDSIEQGYNFKSIEPGQYILEKYFENQSLRPGCYTINTSILQKGIDVHLFYWMGAASIVVREPKDRLFFSNPHAVWHTDVSLTLEKTPSNDLSSTSS